MKPWFPIPRHWNRKIKSLDSLRVSTGRLSSGTSGRLWICCRDRRRLEDWLEKTGGCGDGGWPPPLGIHTKRCLPPSRERVHIPPWEKENHLETWLFRGHVSFQDGIYHVVDTTFFFFFGFFAHTLGFHDPIDYIIFFQGVETTN